MGWIGVRSRVLKASMWKFRARRKRILLGPGSRRVPTPAWGVPCAWVVSISPLRGREGVRRGQAAAKDVDCVHLVSCRWHCTCLRQCPVAACAPTLSAWRLERAAVPKPHRKQSYCLNRRRCIGVEGPARRKPNARLQLSPDILRPRLRVAKGFAVASNDADFA